LLTYLLELTGVMCLRLPDYNECSRNPCRGGARCNDNIGLFLCQCPANTTGRICERRNCPLRIVLLFCSPIAVALHSVGRGSEPWRPRRWGIDSNQIKSNLL